MKHKGEILQKAIKESGIKLSRVIEESGIPKATIYKVFSQANPKLDYVIKIGKVINMDFSNDFPELSNKYTKDAEENLSYKIKYMQLAEKLIQVLEEKEEYRKELEAIRKKK